MMFFTVVFRFGLASAGVENQDEKEKTSEFRVSLTNEVLNNNASVAKEFLNFCQSLYEHMETVDVSLQSKQGKQVNAFSLYSMYSDPLDKKTELYDENAVRISRFLCKNNDGNELREKKWSGFISNLRNRLDYHFDEYPKPNLVKLKNQSSDLPPIVLVTELEQGIQPDNEESISFLKDLLNAYLKPPVVCDHIKYEGATDNYREYYDNDRTPVLLHNDTSGFFSEILTKDENHFDILSSTHHLEYKRRYTLTITKDPGITQLHRYWYYYRALLKAFASLWM